MANYPIYRLIKGSTLSFTEMDGNLEWLSRNMSASIVTITGSTYLLGKLTVTDGITGSLYGTSSWSVSSSYAVSASYAISSSYALSASFADTAISASYVSGSGAIVTTLSSSRDANINGLIFGRGSGNIQFNVAIGNQVLLANTVGTQNTAVGNNSLSKVTIGTRNTAVGSNTLSNITISQYNTANGVGSLNGLLEGDNNIGVGFSSAASIKTGSFNTIVGISATAGQPGIVTGSYNTLIGSQISGLSSTLNNNIILADGQGNIKYRWDGTQNNILGGLYVTGGPITGSDALFTGTITAQTLVVQTITSSIIYSSGSNIFGNKSIDTHQFTGSVLVSGSISASSFIKSGGTSTQFLKADGTVDTNTYITAASVGDGTLSLGVSGVGLSGTQTFTANQAGNSTFTVTSNATSANTANTIVSRDASGDFTAGTITASTFVKSGGTSTQFLKADGSVDSNTYYLASNPNGYTSNAGTITSVTVSPGTGMSGGGTLTGAGGTLTLTNAAPDQTVVLTNGTGISATGTYPNFTITNTAPDQTVVLTNGTGISATGTYPSFTITNTAPDQTVVLNNGTGISVTGTYPSFTITNTAPDQTVVLNNGTGISVTGTYPNFTIASTVTDTNIYNSDGTLSANRTIDANGNFLKINNLDTLTLDGGAETNNIVLVKGTEPNINISASGASNAASLFLSPSPTFNGTIQNRTSGGLDFYTGPTPSVAMTIGSNLNVGIGGVANAINSLEISRANQWSVAAIGNLGAARTPSTSYGVYLGWNYTGGSGEANFVWGSGAGTNSHLVFSSFDGTTKTDRVEFQKTGNVVFKQYTSATSFTGTPVGYLGFDASGNILTTTGTGGSLSGGTANYLPVWVNSSTLSISSVYQYSSTQVQLTGSSLAVGDITPSATVGRIDASNDIVAFSTSDIRFKDNVKPIQNAITKVNQISGVEFDWIEDIDHHGNKGHDIGVIAQELEEVLPEVVTTRDSGYKAVKYDKIVALLIQAIKEQQSEINELKSRIDGITK